MLLDVVLVEVDDVVVDDVEVLVDVDVELVEVDVEVDVDDVVEVGAVVDVLDGAVDDVSGSSVVLVDRDGEPIDPEWKAPAVVVEVVAAEGGAASADHSVPSAFDGSPSLLLTVVAVSRPGMSGRSGVRWPRMGMRSSPPMPSLESGTLMPALDRTSDTARWAGDGRAPAPASPPVNPSAPTTTAATTNGPDARCGRAGIMTSAAGAGSSSISITAADGEGRPASAASAISAATRS